MERKDAFGNVLPFRAMVACMLCDTCNDYVSATVGGQCKSCNLTAQIATLRAENERLTKENVELAEALEFDRTAVADCVTKANHELDSRHWLTTGRGSYEWDDDTYQEEFLRAGQAIKQSLEPMTKIAANWKLCPKDGVLVAKARIDIKAENERLREESSKSAERSRIANEVAENYLSHCNAACKQIDALEAERDAALAWGAEMRAALEEIKSHENDAAKDLQRLGFDGPELPWMATLNAALSTPPSTALANFTARVRAEVYREAANLIRQTTPWDEGYKNELLGRYEGRMDAVQQIEAMANPLDLMEAKNV